MSDAKQISIISDIYPYEYKPKLYYERKCQNGKTGDEETFFRVWHGSGSACNFYMPMMLTIYSNPIFIGKAKVKNSAQCLYSVIERAANTCTQEDKQFLYDLVELSLNYSSITGSSTPVKAAKALGKALTRFTKMAAKQITAPLNIWEQKQLVYAMYCAIGIYLINSRVFQEQYSISSSEGVAAYKKAISSGNKDLMTYGVGKAAVDINKIIHAGLFRD